MLFQQVCPIITIEITPHEVNVVGVVLCIIKFYQKCFSLDAVIMWFSSYKAAGPAKAGRIVQINIGGEGRVAVMIGVGGRDARAGRGNQEDGRRIAAEIAVRCTL